MNVGQIAHAGGKILRHSLLGDRHMSPRLVRIEEHEQIGRAVALVFVVIPLRLTRPSTTVAYRPYTALTRNILSLSSRHSTKCAILIHCATVVLGPVKPRLL